MGHLSLVVAVLIVGGLGFVFGGWVFYTPPAAPQPAVQATPPAVPTASPQKLPPDARFAITSGDGSTIAAVTGKRDITVLRGGKMSTVGHNAYKPMMKLNRDGTRLALFDLWKDEILLWNTEEAKEVARISCGHSPTFHFSPGGERLGVMKIGANEVVLYSADSGTRMVTLKAQNYYEPAKEYVLDSFHFPNPEAVTDENLYVNMVAREFGITVQWKHRGHDWHLQAQTQPFAWPDQAYDDPKTGRKDADKRD